MARCLSSVRHLSILKNDLYHNSFCQVYDNSRGKSGIFLDRNNYYENNPSDNRIALNAHIL